MYVCYMCLQESKKEKKKKEKEENGKVSRSNACTHAYMHACLVAFTKSISDVRLSF